MKRALFLAVILSVIIPVSVYAHGNNYLEFNPDYFNTKPLNVSGAGDIREIFLPVNEFLSGVDFWFDNSGSSGTVFFQLLDQSNNLITSKNVTVPHINPVEGGQRVHVDFNSQLPVIGSNIYKIKISSSLPELQIYYADRIKVLGHNQPHASDYINGAAEIDGQEKEFSFKYALYETAEPSAPIISGIGWTAISEYQMRIDFNANEPIDFKIDYGVTGQGYTQSIPFTDYYQFCTPGITTCYAMVAVSPDTSYQYVLTIKDSWGNQSQATGTFTSGQVQTPSPTPTPTIQLPVISNLRIIDVTDSSVGVAWTTNEIADSRLLIVLNGFISVAAKSDSTFELEHFLEIEGALSAGAPYLANVTSIDSDNNEIKASISFTTLSNQPSPSPSPSNSPPLSSPTPSTTTSPQPSLTVSPQVSSPVSPTPQSSDQPQGVTTSPISGGTGTVQWGTPKSGEPSKGYRVDVFDKAGNLKISVLVSDGSHKAEISDLKDDNYSVIVYANNDGVFEKVDKPKQLKQEESFIQRLISLWPYLLVAVGIIIGLLIWLRTRKKASQISTQVVS